MKAQKLFLAVLTSLLLIGCGNKSKDLSDKPAPNTYKETVEDGRYNDKVAPSGTVGLSGDADILKTSFNTEIPVLKDRMIIRRGNINVEIETYTDAEKKVSDAVAKANGYITNTNSTVNVSGKKQGSIEARIPAEKYDAFIADVRTVGKVMSENISGNDVTEEYIDLEARQKTQHELEKRLLDLLNEKTAKLVDVVEVEEKLSGVRENIERTEGRMKFLKSQASYSTLTISLFEPALLQTSSGGGFFYEMKTAVGKGLEGFTDLLGGLVAFIIAFSPVLIFIFVVMFFVRRHLRNKKNKNINLQPQN